MAPTGFAVIGLHGNTTARCRRYIGDIDKRPLLPEHDLENAENLLIPHRWQVISRGASGPLAQFYREGRRWFALRDAAPYERE